MLTLSVMARLLFLDIDGVLNHYGSAGKIDRACVARLNHIVERTGAVVVISSTWRVTHSPEQMQRLLTGHGFSGEVVGDTPCLYGRPRGEEVAAYLDDNGEVEAFAIVDDNADLEPVADHLVLVDDFVGLSDADVAACVELLSSGASGQ
jgi:hypothetical protein